MAYVRHIFSKESIREVTSDDIETLIRNKTEEFLNLDYEAIPDKNITYDGLARHISGFLNSSGGLIIFGVKEATEGKHKIPCGITWNSLINKETVERNLFPRIEPWSEDITIFPIANPRDASQRIFLIEVPKSKNPPHMANHKYYIRLNFEAEEMGHTQVSDLFKQSYIQKLDLTNNVYGPIYNELYSFFNKEEIEEWHNTNFNQIRTEKMYLLMQDPELMEQLNEFYARIENWNKAVATATFRIVKLTNALAGKFFRDKIKPLLIAVRGIYMDIKAETTSQCPTIYGAILNGEDPVQSWKKRYPYDKVTEITFRLKYLDNSRNEKDMRISREVAEQFIGFLKAEVTKEELIAHVHDEWSSLREEIMAFLTDLEEKME